MFNVKIANFWKKKKHPPIITQAGAPPLKRGVEEKKARPRAIPLLRGVEGCVTR